MSSSKNHPLPVPPGQQRPRAKSNFSFRSTHSRKSSSSSHNKIDLHESHAEKESKRLQTKADPQMALNEAEPSVVAREKASLAPIRAIQHRDNQGNPIADPDRSNPTRSRWERPLDTIRSFEAAIDGNYSRKSYIRTESDGQSTYNRQSSYFGGTQVTTDERPRGPNGYYGGRSQSYRPDSYADGRANGMTRPDSYYNDHSNGYHPNRARYPRTASEPHFNGSQGVYPMPGNQSSYETVATASGSGSSDPAGYQTPLSENSSVDRVAPLPPMKEPGESYGFTGFGGGPQYAPPGSNLQEQQHYGGNSQTRQANGYPTQVPQVPRKESASRVPIKLGKSNGYAGPPQNESQRPAAGEKRKSWFGKRFSRS
ncbi:hypothetical protein ONS95_007837 [Cadophora gregata]|uniref:uncharacterized protein n=1 Tax=Cadophora gregata TaxID=51156 RepID=UPI0026DC12B3|nr:uncharacterized protein ONS95_007837 [Cadophora gregata]KAK0118970.1 hypothetical protein ONS96_012043 [Cadophora gregata f. sp. sojae]KAK0126223.1 hypothetical protein ONS95_007837 [Cadophora gregata]